MPDADFFFFTDTKKDIKAIIAHLLDMLPSKKVSGHGRDRALNLLNKNVPRQDLKIHDNSRSIFVIDNGKQCLHATSLQGRVMALSFESRFERHQIESVYYQALQSIVSSVDMTLEGHRPSKRFAKLTFNMKERTLLNA